MSLLNFEIIKKLGEGAFSNVFKVNRRSDGQSYALKKVKLGHLSMREKENALNEIRILASFSHPNIIAYKDSFIDEASNTLCIVMELAEGGDLMKKINERKKESSPFAEFEIWVALVQITNGLKILHNANIIHRDLKCANIFVTKEGLFKLGDLNVSKVNKRGLAYTQTGTPYYASPEVWRDKPYTYSSDIWSLGCVIYEMAAFEPPFTASDMQALFKRIVRGEYNNIPSIYSEGLSRVIRQLLQVNPLLRPTCEKIIEIPGVQRYINLSPASSQESTTDLLKTIKFEPCMQDLKKKLPSSNYESRGGSASSKILQSASGRELSARVNPEFNRNYSLHTRDSPKVPLGRQVSLEALERNYKNRNLLRLDGDMPEMLNKLHMAVKPPAISPDKYARKIEEIVNRKFPDSRPKVMNKYGMMVVDTPKPPLKMPPLQLDHRDAGIHNVAVNPMWQG